MHERGVNAILADEMVSSESYYVGFLIKDQEYKQAKIAWEKKSTYRDAIPGFSAKFSDVWGATAEVQTDDLLTMCSAHSISSVS